MENLISVSLVYDGKRKKSIPRSIIWNNKIYRVKKIGLHHTYKKGDTLYHVFSAIAGTMYFKLVLDTANLHWSLEELQDSLLS